MSDLILDDAQQMLADSVRKYVERGYGASVRRASIDHPQGCSPERWEEFAELGWLALPVPEEDGGLGGSISDICVIAEELGRGLVNEPFVASAVLGAMLLADVASTTVRMQWLPGIAEGSQRVAFAPWEPGARFDMGAIDTRAEPIDKGFRLHGEKTLVPGGAGADAYLLAARLADSGLIGLFLIPAATEGLTVTPQVFYDGQHATRLRMDGMLAVDALAVGPAAEVLALLEKAMDRAIVAHCAETVGVMARTFDITLDYLKTRKQFGRAIAANQVVQHRMVDLYVEIEEARALTRAAATQLAQQGEKDASSLRRRYSAAAKACVSLAAKHVWEESVQLHGAIGMTEEYAVGKFIKRLALASTLYGGVEFQLERLVEVSFGNAAGCA